MMIGMALVQELVDSVVLTGKLAEHAPVSLLLIASPESGKTSIATEKHCKNVMPFSDITGKGLMKIIQQKPELTHIVFNDLVAVLSHKDSVNRYTLAMINAITEEGVTATATPEGIETFTSGKKGVIASLTYELARDGRQWWNKIGLTSRMFPFAYDFSFNLTVDIKDFIDGQINGHKQKGPKQKRIVLPPKLIAVRFAPTYVKQVRRIADNKAQELGEKGFRRLKQFQSLAAGHALYRSRKRPTVGEPEIEFLERILPHVSYKDCKQLEETKK